MLPNNLDVLDDYLVRVALRPDVKAAQRRQTAAQENISVARGEHLPSLDLNANRYLERTGSLENVEWDVQLALTVPLYAGFGISTPEQAIEAASLCDGIIVGSRAVEIAHTDGLRGLVPFIASLRAALDSQ